MRANGVWNLRSKFGVVPADSAASAEAASEKSLAHSNVPIRVPEHFLGREDALEAVDAALKRYEGRVAITAVHGLRGVGKTMLAAAYAERHARDYLATWWVRALTPDGMRADLVALGVRLGWVAPEKEAAAIEKGVERLRREGDGLLLVYDNAIDADAVRPFLPKGGAARVLVTSNAHAWRGLAEPIELKLWPKEIGGTISSRGWGARASARTRRPCRKRSACHSPTSRRRPIASGSACRSPTMPAASLRSRLSYSTRPKTRRPNITTG